MSAYDPKRTSANNSCCSSEASFTPKRIGSKRRHSEFSASHNWQPSAVSVTDMKIEIKSSHALQFRLVVHMSWLPRPAPATPS
jgi:hypothetical protein